MNEMNSIRITSTGKIIGNWPEPYSGIVYGYARVSTAKQQIGRQVDNIRRFAPDAVIVQESYTGTTTNRPEWNKLSRKVKPGDTIVFDEVSRMSRNADEGFRLYQDLFGRGVKLVFLKERHIDTEVYRKALETRIQETGNKVVDFVLEGVNNALMELARQQIEIAFQTAQAEVDYLHQRTSEGVRKAQLNGKTVGRAVGATVETRKAKAAKEVILKYSKDFGGTLPDKDVLTLTGVDRGTYYRYKKQLRQTDAE